MFRNINITKILILNLIAIAFSGLAYAGDKDKQEDPLFVFKDAYKKTNDIALTHNKIVGLTKDVAIIVMPEVKYEQSPELYTVLIEIDRPEVKALKQTERDKLFYTCLNLNQSIIELTKMADEVIDLKDKIEDDTLMVAIDTTITYYNEEKGALEDLEDKAKDIMSWLIELAPKQYQNFNSKKLVISNDMFDIQG